MLIASSPYAISASKGFARPLYFQIVGETCVYVCMCMYIIYMYEMMMKVWHKLRIMIKFVLGTGMPKQNKVKLIWNKLEIPGQVSSLKYFIFPVQ